MLKLVSDFEGRGVQIKFVRYYNGILRLGGSLQSDPRPYLGTYRGIIK